MTTEKQIEANKHNALVSTGPVTVEGKVIVSLNAVKHGIFARDLIITSGDGKEDMEEYIELLDGLIVSLNPNGQMECLLVEKIAVDFWRLRRVLRFENGSICQFRKIILREDEKSGGWNYLLKRHLIKKDEEGIKATNLPGLEDTEKILKYEKSIQKSIFQNLAILKKLQSLPDDVPVRQGQDG